MEHSQRFKQEYKDNALVILQSNVSMANKHDALLTLNALLSALYD